MVRPSLTRRRFVEGSLVAGVATLGSLSGCTSPTGRLPAYAQWLPAPETVLVDERDGSDPPPAFYPFGITDFDDYEAHYDRIEKEWTPDVGEAIHPVLPVGPGDASVKVSSNRGLEVLETGLNQSTIVEAFTSQSDERSDFSTVGSYEGFRILSNEDGTWVAGVNGGTVVEAFTSFSQRMLQDKRTVVERTIDANAGSGDRYVDASDALERLVTRLGSGTAVQGSEYPSLPAAESDDLVATGASYDLDGSTLRARSVILFEDESAAAVDAFAEHGVQGYDWERVDRYVDGRAAIAEGTVAVTDFFD